LGEGDFIIVGRNKNTTPQSAACEFLREVGFSIGRDVPELYLKMFGRLGLYISKQLKNGSTMKKCAGECIQARSLHKIILPMRKEYGSMTWAS